ncbi:uncharacterized protein V2V93DRAFT_375913 [Kockiozyma suomiensis]|uniref:uncharacterized protein n=1 Tax=Kockiozyma suomiensis TaxID=1337062 RepID=UPI003343D314
MTKLLLTGATGYVGGAALDRIIAFNIPDLEVTVFLRSESKAAPILAKYPGIVTVKVGKAAYSDPEFSRLVKEADIIVHAGDSSDDSVSADVISTNIKDGVLLIHTSGTYILSDFTELDQKISRKFDDERDIETVTSWGLEHPHRVIDIKILDIHKFKPTVNTIIVCPPLIYGVSTGPVNRVSQQIPLLIQLAAETKANRLFGTGHASWSNVHINDVAELYAILVKTYLQDASKLAVNDQGYYFVENGETSWKDLISALDEPLVKYKVIDSQHTSDKLRPWTEDDLKEVRGQQFAKRYYEIYRSNSSSKATRARKLGWQPKEKDVYSTLDEAVNVYLNGLSD